MNIQVIGNQKLAITGDGRAFFHIYEGHQVRTKDRYGWLSFGINEHICDFLTRRRLILCVIDGDRIGKYYRLILRPEYVMKQAYERGEWDKVTKRGGWEKRDGLDIIFFPFNLETFATFEDGADLEEALKLLG